MLHVLQMRMQDSEQMENHWREQMTASILACGWTPLPKTKKWETHWRASSVKISCFGIRCNQVSWPQIHYYFSRRPTLWHQNDVHAFLTITYQIMNKTQFPIHWHHLCSDSAFLPSYFLSMLPLPFCLTTQFYSFNQLLFPVILSISSSSIHLLASIPTNPSAPILNRWVW